MCGIVGYTGPNAPYLVALDGLKRLEYRGYDSAGIAYSLDSENIIVQKTVGRVKDLEEKFKPLDSVWLSNVRAVIGHTRWATHGGVEDKNAHPHQSNWVTIVHNGVIDNVEILREEMERAGYTFVSDTDSEVIAHLLDYYYETCGHLEALEKATSRLMGTYGIAVLFKDYPGMIGVAKNGSPLVIGIGDDDDFYIASDTNTLVAYTDRFIYLEDGDVAVMSDGCPLAINNTREIQQVEQEDAYAELGDYEHFMLKEIHEQPKAITRCFASRIRDTHCRLNGFRLSNKELAETTSVTILGCGTSYHAGLIAKHYVEKWAGIPCFVELASEFPFKELPPDKTGIYLAVSQSGETYDTLECIKELHKKGINVFGVVNTVGSSIARLCGAGVYIHAGPEISVASTKAFTTQCAALQMFACMLGRSKRMSLSEGHKATRELTYLPARLNTYMHDIQLAAETVAGQIKDAKYILFLGRGKYYPVALEGALKMKEIAYIPCEAYAAGEMKHGPIAMIEEGTPVICIVPLDEQQSRMVASVQEVKARGAKIIAVDSIIPADTDYTAEYYVALYLQFLAYYVALELGRDIDKPRNLAKSVTVF